jgi:predicted ATPase
MDQPERIFQLLASDLPAAFPPLQTLAVRPGNLPASLVPLIGRQKEVETARELLRRENLRLLTMTGPGGTGKTRLALQVAADLLADFRDGVFFVDLAPIRDPELLASTIAQTLNVRETGDQPLIESLHAALREKQLLLVLDNFEQILAAAPRVVALLSAAPRLKALVTSRAALHVSGEQEFPVPPLSVPDPDQLPPLPVLAQYGAVALFVQRAEQAKLGSTLMGENAAAVAAICHRLDGLPLAVELAASRVKLFSPEALLARMQSRLKLLTGGRRDQPARQQTMRDTIAWSYDLLEEEEKRLFQRLAVFVGGCTLEAVDAVCDAEGDLGLDVLDGAASLADKSLLRQEERTQGEPRFMMLETIREFAWERLEESRETEATQRRHAQFFLALAERAEPKLSSAAQKEWLDRLEGEQDNFRAVLAWCQTEAGDGEIELRLAGALWWFWWLRCYWSEARSWLAAALTRSGGSGCTVARAKALEGAGLLARDRRLSKESVALFRELGDRLGLGSALRTLGMMMMEAGDQSAARAHYEESLAICQETGDRRGLVPTLFGLGELAELRGDLAAAQSLGEEGIAVCHEVGEQWNLGWLHLSLGRLAKKQGDRERAYDRYKESLAIFQELDNEFGIIVSLEWLAMLTGAQEEPERAARLFGAAASLREAIGAGHLPSPGSERTHVIRVALGEEAFAAAWEEGQAMTLEQAIEYALEAPSGETPGLKASCGS